MFAVKRLFDIPLELFLEAARLTLFDRVSSDHLIDYSLEVKRVHYLCY